MRTKEPSTSSANPKASAPKQQRGSVHMAIGAVSASSSYCVSISIVSIQIGAIRPNGTCESAKAKQVDHVVEVDQVQGCDAQANVAQISHRPS